MDIKPGIRCPDKEHSGPLIGRLNFKLPTFVRLCWANQNAREVWAPRLRRIIRAWADMEWMSVGCGIRACAIIRRDSEELSGSLRKFFASAGFKAVPLESEDDPTGHSMGKYEQRDLYAVGSESQINQCKAAWKAEDDQEVGRLLAYPVCCREAYVRRCVVEKWTDPIWLMAANTVVAQDRLDFYAEIKGAPLTNIIWRTVGVRVLPYLPCQFGCSESIRLGQLFLDLGNNSGFAAEMNWLLEILSWPVEWSALHGIAEIKTPLFKLTTNTDATSRKLCVRIMGQSYPHEGAQGVVFPYKSSARSMTDSRSYQRGIQTCSDLVQITD